MHRWFRQRLWMWMILVAAVAVLLAHQRVAADRRAAAEAATRRFIELVDSSIAAQVAGEQQTAGPGLGGDGPRPDPFGAAGPTSKEVGRAPK